LEVEARLMQLVPQERWTRTTDLFIFHGRKVCDARRPECGRCPIFALCRFEDRRVWARGSKPAGVKSRGARPRGTR
ncbi:MAG TPA: endonuclease III, partial [Vicinamibacteria bacterium]